MEGINKSSAMFELAKIMKFTHFHRHYEEVIDPESRHDSGSLTNLPVRAQKFLYSDLLPLL